VQAIDVALIAGAHGIGKTPLPRLLVTAILDALRIKQGLAFGTANLEAAAIIGHVGTSTLEALIVGFARLIGALSPLSISSFTAISRALTLFVAPVGFLSGAVAPVLAFLSLVAPTRFVHELAVLTILLQAIAPVT